MLRNLKSYMIKKTLKWTVALLLVSVLTLVVFSNYQILHETKNYTFSKASEIKKNRVGLVLGTSKYYKGGGLNLYFKNRIDATVELFNAKKIDFILVSGDNSTMSYNEPMNFKKELLKRGIPEEVIFLDYAGFRTLDSVVRAKEIFGQVEITIISQQFHNERAIYIAQKHGMKAVGFNADSKGAYGLRMQVREYFARTKAFLDIQFGVEPKFLGEKIEIELMPLPEKNDSVVSPTVGNGQ